MKKFIAILCLAFLIMAFCACGNENVPNSTQSCANNTDVEDSQNGEMEQLWYTVYKSGEVVALQTEKFECDGSGNCLKIPVLPVLRELGADIEWVSTFEAVASKNGKEYLINYSKHTFTEKGTEKNLLDILDNQGNYGYNYVYENGTAKLLVEFEILRALMAKIDAPIYVKGYSENAYVWSDYSE